MNRKKTIKPPHPRSIRGVSQRHGISEQLIRNQMAAGLLGSYKVGRLRFISDDQEAAWMAGWHQ